MKANQAFKTSDEAVSAVVGVILLVAITVVLAAVVYVIATRLSDGGSDPPAPNIEMIRNEDQDRATVISADAGTLWEDISMRHDAPVNLKYALNAQAGTATDMSASGPATWNPETARPFSSGNGQILATHYLSFCSTSGTLTDVTVGFIHTETNTRLTELTFGTLRACS